MEIKEGRQLLNPFIEAAEAQGDPFFIVHFSRTDDKYKGYHEGLDSFDALIIVKQLIQHFNIDPQVLSVMNLTHQNKEEVLWNR